LRFIPRFVRQPRLRLAWLLTFGRSAWWTMFFIYAPIFCVESGLGEEMAGIILSAGSAAILLVPLFGRLGRRVGLRPVLAIGYLSTGLVTILIAVVADHPWTGVAFILAATVCAALIDAAGNALFMRAVHPHERAEMASVFMTYREAGQLVPPGVFAMLLSVFALPVVFVASGVSMVLLTYMTRYIPRRY
jgi:MFS family permease